LQSLRQTLGPHGLTTALGHPWPIELKAPEKWGEELPHFAIEGSQSSQFASSLLLAAAALHLRERRPFEVELLGAVASRGYLDLTIDWLLRCGFEVEVWPTSLRVAGWKAPEQWPQVPGDWSSLGYLMLVAWKTGGIVSRVDMTALHPDRELVRVVEGVGLQVEALSGARAQLKGKASRGLTASGERCPDLLPTLAALACVLPGHSVLTEVSILRHKESDRLEGICALVAAAGGNTRQESPERLVIEPSPRVNSFVFDSRGDHRLAMAAATLSVLSNATLELTGPECVEKSFPGFWGELARSGVGLTPMPRA
jgi:3-phosphoshikimate 1-carboxyvinyltransferase